jgi:hypothetical protein
MTSVLNQLLWLLIQHGMLVVVLVLLVLLLALLLLHRRATL